MCLEPPVIQETNPDAQRYQLQSHDCTPGPVVSLDKVIPRLRNKITVLDFPHPVLLSYCWIWTGRNNRNGYGRVSWGGKEPVAHRLIWELHIGPIPPKHLLDHLCRNRNCVNPHHMEPVTVQVNTLRGKAILFQRQHQSGN